MTPQILTIKFMATRRPRSNSRTPPVEIDTQPQSKITGDAPSFSPAWYWSIGFVAISLLAAYSLSAFLQGHMMATSQPNISRKSDDIESQPTSPAPKQPKEEITKSPKHIYAAVNPAVFTIYNLDGSQGSGFFIDQNGTGVTNHHVVKDFAVIRIKISDNRQFDAKVIRKDEQSDLAIISIAAPVSCIPINTQSLRSGEVVYALGSPLGMEHTFTNGIVSRQEGKLNLYHTAAIAPGSSGSPLLDSEGKLIGINKAVITKFTALAIATPVQALQELYPNFNCK